MELKFVSCSKVYAITVPALEWSIVTPRAKLECRSVGGVGGYKDGL